MKVTVLRGGPSNEREVSLIGGAAVANALRRAGHDVTEADILPTDLSALELPADVIFPVLHGSFGESGELQEILENRRLRFVGSGSAASRLGIDKLRTKQLWQQLGLPTPAWEILSADTPLPSRLADRPCVIKPISGGSSIDVRICKTKHDASKAAKSLLPLYGKLLVEQFIPGPEITVGILGDQVLSPIRITTTHEFFDYHAKYIGNESEHHFDLGLPAQSMRQIQEMSLQAHRAIGCRDLSRLDLMLDETNSPWLLEINTMPGFTPKSLLPDMARHDGISFEQLVDRLVRQASARPSIMAA